MLAFNRCSLVGETCSSGKSYTNERNSCISNTVAVNRHVDWHALKTKDREREREKERETERERQREK